MLTVPTRPIRNRYLLLLDALALSSCAWAGYALRFESLAPLSDFASPLYAYIAITVPLRLVVFIVGGLYRRLWRHASVTELEQLFLVGAAGAVVTGAFGAWGMQAFGLMEGRIPLSVLALDMIMTVAAPAASRLLIRIGLLQRLRDRRRLDEAARVVIVGAGSTGQMIAKELLGNPRLQMVPVGFIDDDPGKQKKVIAGLPVLGPLEALAHQASQVKATRLIIAMPNASGVVVRQVVKVAMEHQLETRTVPGLAELLSGRANVNQLRDVEIQDLLRREPVVTDLKSVSALASGRVVLVTGAGGSIGSELCRQLSTLSPSRLVLLGHGENSIFDIYHELRERFPALHLTPVIADIRDRDRIARVLGEVRPHAIFHAAAHKHVPLMEENPIEAVTNNVAGTRNVVDAAVLAGTAHFVLISTDKAVRPTSIMGATKRIAEMVTQAAAARHERNFVAVRFGNVLGSRGSVVPTFLRQIRAGGPVRVTHPEMRRYFMTIPEAVQLVLQAGALGRGKEVFVLDMGEPVRVMDVATDLIRLSGLEVGTDIEIAITGVRPGEKLYEEMFFSNENASPTDHPKVLRAKLPPLEDAEFRIAELIRAAESGASDAVLRARIVELVPDFQPVDYERITPVEAIAVVAPPQPVPSVRIVEPVPVAPRSSRPGEPVIVS
ncbi:MAG: polysaccharide biosynthesis protein [Gemmatimonadetes bacterium]|nr:polysaccharide biosynthesis protein [Gemmatimonadota bacterium]